MKTKTALIVVDIQNDFCPGGALAVPGGDRVVEPVNRLVDFFESRRLSVYFTRDWHPPDHVSFKKYGGPWPEHCVAGSEEAAFHPDIRIPAEAVIISKADESSREAYSGFDGTDLEKRLRKQGVGRLVVVGLATDYCVKATALDSLKAGFDVEVVAEAVRAVDVRPGDGEKAVQEMEQAGARFVKLEDFLRLN